MLAVKTEHYGPGREVEGDGSCTQNTSYELSPNIPAHHVRPFTLSWTGLLGLEEEDEEEEGGITQCAQLLNQLQMLSMSWMSKQEESNKISS